MYDARQECQECGRAYFVQLAIRSVEQVSTAFLDPDERMAAERSLRRGHRTVRLLAGTQAEESKLAFDSAWCQVDRPIVHVTRVQEAGAWCPFRWTYGGAAMDRC